MATVEKRNLTRKDIVLESKPAGSGEEEVPVVTATIQELTCMEAMDADDFALSQSKTGRPSIARIIKMYAIFSVVKLNGRDVSPKSNEIEYEKFLEQLKTHHIDRLCAEYRVFANEIAEAHDPKSSPSEKPSE